MPTHAYMPMVRIGIHRWKPCKNVQAMVPATPMTGVSDRKRMFTQSFFRDSMTTPPRLFTTGIELMVFAVAPADGRKTSGEHCGDSMPTICRKRSIRRTEVCVASAMRHRDGGTAGEWSTGFSRFVLTGLFSQDSFSTG